MKQNLLRAIRLWVWLRFLYGDERDRLWLSEPFKFADWRQAFFTPTHSKSELIPHVHDPDCACAKTTAEWLFDSRINVSKQEWRQSLQQHDSIVVPKPTGSANSKLWLTHDWHNVCYIITNKMLVFGTKLQGTRGDQKMSLERVVKSSDIAKPAISRDLRRTGIHPDYWYPLACSHQLKNGKTLGVTFAGEPIVLVRTKSGTLFALEDRCAHRQIPLHAGVVCGEYLQCCYHCWTYDKTGKCINVPYLDQNKSLPKGVRSYPCREAYGLIFVFPGNSQKQDVVPFPEIPSQADRRYKTRYFARQIRCHYSFMHENLMDMNHQFLHRRLMGRIQTILLAYRHGENWVEAEYMLESFNGSPLGEKLILGKKPHFKSETQLRDMTIRTQYPYQTLQVWDSENGPPVLDLWTTYVPVDREQRVNHSFGLVMIRKPSIPGLIYILWPFIGWFMESIFTEDRWIVEQEQKAFDFQGADWNQEIFPVVQELRSLLRRQGIPL